MKITSATRLIPGLTARNTSRGIVVASLHYTADPDTFTPAVLDMERERLGCARNADGSWRLSWRFRKEMMLDWDAQVGQQVFEQEWMDAQLANLREPLWRMDLDEGGKLIRSERGRLAVFVDPSEPLMIEGDGIRGMLRSFGMGMDVSEGVEASDSTIELFAVDTREQAAEFADSRITPSDLGRFAVATARYFNDALICCVRKMHGITAIRVMVDECKYYRLWRHKTEDRLGPAPAQTLGWARGESSDLTLFGPWIDAVQYNRVRLRSVALADQHKQYLYDERGMIVIAKLSNAPPAVRMQHGDMVIGCALAERACRDAPQYARLLPTDAPPANSYAAREAARQREKERTTKW